MVFEPSLVGKGLRVVEGRDDLYLLISEDKTGAFALSECGGREGKREVGLDVKREGVEGEVRGTTEEGREKFDRESEEREEEEGIE